MVKPKEQMPRAEIGRSYRVLRGRAVHFPRAWGLYSDASCWASAGQILRVTNELERAALQDEIHKVEPMSGAMLNGALPPVAVPPAAASHMRDKLRASAGRPGMTPEEALANEAPEPTTRKKPTSRKKAGRISAAAAAAASGASPSTDPDAGGSDE